MSSNHIHLFVVVFIGVFTTTAAQVVCLNPTVIGELRVMRSKKCVNIDGFDGLGNVNTYSCDGFDDQRIIMCGDGSIRNTKSPNNCFTSGTAGKGNVKSSTCKVYPSLPDYQKWRFGKSKTFFDSFGIEQEAKEIINVESGFCLNVEGSDGTGNINTHRCEDMTDQYFFIRSKGQLVSHGRLQVQESGLCLDVQSGSSGPRLGDNVRIYECENSADQYFGFYENGEIVNEKSKMCLNVAGFEGKGNIDMHACDYFDDQHWLRPDQYCDGDYCSFVNKKSGHCLNVHGTAAGSNKDVYSHSCTGERDQRFKFVTGTWVTPTTSWSLVGCNENGEVTQLISNTIGYSTSVSESTTIEISTAIEAGYSFGKMTFSTTFSQSLAMEWTESQEKSEEITFTCQVYDNGQPFTGGCMWQLKLTTEQTVKADDELVWTPQIVRCTSEHTAPTCPPFTRCQDKACTMCEGTLFGKKKRKHSAKRFFWKKISKTHKPSS
jgi:hypothetical protein